MEMTFREAVKLIHPDVNSNITDAGGKMNTLVMYKNEPKKIYLWMLKWGLVKNNQQTVEKNYIWKCISRLGVHSFWNGNVIIEHKNGHKYYVHRTTGKRAYFTDGQGLKYCSVKSIKKAWMKEFI